MEDMPHHFKNYEVIVKPEAGLIEMFVRLRCVVMCMHSIRALFKHHFSCHFRNEHEDDVARNRMQSPDLLDWIGFAKNKCALRFSW